MLTLVVAVDQNNVIGANGGIPWKSKADMKRFKERTMGGNLVMGRKTWESIGRPLPGRRHAVVTRDPAAMAVKWAQFPDVKFFPSYEQALGSYLAYNDPIFVVGGAEIYEAALKFEDFPLFNLDVTTVEESSTIPDGATVTHMPAIPFQEWDLLEEVRNPDDVRLVHRIYRRKGCGTEENQAPSQNA
jgi:dihydrofolate reductase